MNATQVMASSCINVILWVLPVAIQSSEVLQSWASRNQAASTVSMQQSVCRTTHEAALSYQTWTNVALLSRLKVALPGAWRECACMNSYAFKCPCGWYP